MSGGCLSNVMSNYGLRVQGLRVSRGSGFKGFKGFRCKGFRGFGIIVDQSHLLVSRPSV